MPSQINSKLACGKLLSWRYCPSLGLYAVWLAVLSLVFLLEIGLSSRIIQKKKRRRFATWNPWLSRKSKDSDPYVYFSKIIQCPKMIWALRQIVFPVWGCPQQKSWGTPPSCKEESLLSPPPWQPQWLFQDLLHIWRFMPLAHSSPSFWLHEFQSWRPCTEFFPNICFWLWSAKHKASCCTLRLLLHRFFILNDFKFTSLKKFVDFIFRLNRFRAFSPQLIFF